MGIKKQQQKNRKGDLNRSSTDVGDYSTYAELAVLINGFQFKRLDDRCLSSCNSDKLFRGSFF